MIDTKEIRKALAIHGVDVLNEDEVLDVLDHLEAAYKEIESWKGLARQFGNEADELRTHLSFAKDELNRLRAKIAEMEKQEPVAWMSSRNGFIVKDNKNHDYNLPLYLSPGAQPAPSISPVALRHVIQWLRNGCDPMKAADELEMLAAAPEAKP